MSSLFSVPKVSRGGPTPAAVAFNLLAAFLSKQGYSPFSLASLEDAGFAQDTSKEASIDSTYEWICRGLINHDMHSSRLRQAHLVPEEFLQGASVQDLKEKMAEAKSTHEITLMKSLHDHTPASVWRHPNGIDVLHQEAVPGRYLDAAIYVVVHQPISNEEASELLGLPSLERPSWWKGPPTLGGTHSSSRHRAGLDGVLSVTSHTHYAGRDTYTYEFDGSWFPEAYRDAAKKWRDDKYIPALIARVYHSSVSV